MPSQNTQQENTIISLQLDFSILSTAWNHFRMIKLFKIDHKQPAVQNFLMIM